MPSRAQSSTIGVILLTAVVVITVGSAGVFVFSGIGGDDTVRADLVVIQTNESLTIEHNGGEAVPFSEVIIVVEGNERLRPAVNRSGLTRGDDDELFEPGERWVWNRSFDPDVAWTVRAFGGGSQLPVQRYFPEASGELSGAEPSGSLDEPPTVVVDSPGKARVGESVRFDASGSRDPDGGLLSYEWSFDDGSDNVTRSSVDHTFSSVGTYDVTVNVTDDEGNSVLKTARIEIKDSPDVTGPTVSVSQPNETTVVRGSTTHLIRWSATDDQNSNASGVDSVTLEYSLDSGGTWEGIDFDGENDGAFEWNVPGVNTTDAEIRVTATDGAGNSANATSGAFTIDADDPTVDSVSPNASAPTYTQSGQDVSVSWTTSDATTGVSSVAVSIENDTTTVANTTAAAANGTADLAVPSGTAEGNYSVVVEATDAVGNSRIVERSDAVVVDDTAPALTLEVQDESERNCVRGWWWWCIEYNWNEEYQYQWSSSDDSPYELSFSAERDGNTLATSAQESGSGTVSPRSKEGATYRFVLSATDRAGNTAGPIEITDTRGGPEREFIESTGGVTNQAPIATLSYDPASAMIGETVSFGAEKSEDPDGGDLSYEWSFGDASTNATGVAPDHAYDRVGTYTVTLTVTDDEGRTDTTTEQVTVGYALNAGGQEEIGSSVTYAADDGSNPYLYGPGTISGTDDDIANTSRDALYQSVRYGEFGYAIPAQDGEYRITIEVAETYWKNDGKRVFDVIGEGNVLVDNLDIYDRVGHDEALVLTRTVTVTDGELNVEFATVEDNALLGALRIERIGPANPNGGGIETRSANETIQTVQP